MGTYADVDIQRDFSGVFDEHFIQEVATCLEDEILVANLTLNDKIKLLKLRKR